MNRGEVNRGVVNHGVMNDGVVSHERRKLPSPLPETREIRPDFVDLVGPRRAARGSPARLRGRWGLPSNTPKNRYIPASRGEVAEWLKARPC